MNKMVKIAVMLVALTSVFSFADEDKGGFKLGFQGGFGGDNGAIGLLFNLGNGLELGLGIAIYSNSVETTTESTGPSQTSEDKYFSWAIGPSVSYQLGKKDLVSFGAGLDTEFRSWSASSKDAGVSLTIEPAGIDMAFLPNFYIQVEPVKNFAIGLKTGFKIDLPGNKVDEGANTKTTEKESTITTSTELFVSFYL